MEMSFAAQALTTEWSVKNKSKPGHMVHKVQKEVGGYIASLLLQTMGIAIDTLTSEQSKCLHKLGNGHISRSSRR